MGIFDCHLIICEVNNVSDIMKARNSQLGGKDRFFSTSTINSAFHIFLPSTVDFASHYSKLYRPLAKSESSHFPLLHYNAILIKRFLCFHKKKDIQKWISFHN